MKKRKSVKGIICIVPLCSSELHIKVELLAAHFLTYYPIIVPLILIRLCRHNTTLHSLGWAKTHYKVCEMLPLIHMYLSSLIYLSLQIVEWAKYSTWSGCSAVLGLRYNASQRTKFWAAGLSFIGREWLEGVRRRRQLVTHETSPNSGGRKSTLPSRLSRTHPPARVSFT